MTSGAPGKTFTENGRAGGEIQTLLYSMNYSLNYMGFNVLPPRLVAEVQGAGFTYKEPKAFIAGLQEKLEHWGQYLQNIDTVTPMSFPGWNDWDEHGVENML